MGNQADNGQSLSRINDWTDEERRKFGWAVHRIDEEQRLVSEIMSMDLELRRIAYGMAKWFLEMEMGYLLAPMNKHPDPHRWSIDFKYRVVEYGRRLTDMKLDPKLNPVRAKPSEGHGS